MRDSFIFYRSFYEAAQELNSKERLKLFDAVCSYALNGEEIPLSGAACGMFKLLKPQVDANNRRFENGKKGGRPRKNPIETKPKPSINQNKTKSKPNDNVNVNVNVNDNDNYNNGPGSGVVVVGCDEDFDLFKKMGPEDIDRVYDKYPDSGGILINEVNSMVKVRHIDVENPVNYIFGYASNVNWNDKERGAIEWDPYTV